MDRRIQHANGSKFDSPRMRRDGLGTDTVRCSVANVDPYVVLGIHSDASPEEIRAAFRRAVRQRHPDTSPTPTDGAEVRDVIEAYLLLIDPSTRAHHDAVDAPRRSADAQARRVPVQQTPTSSRVSSTKGSPCSTCHGTGTVQSLVSCPGCHGLAEITDLETTPARTLRCLTCRGMGRISSRYRCETCRDSGT